MSQDTSNLIDINIRHQSGSSALLTFHLTPSQRRQLIEALANGQELEIPAQLQLSVQPQWVTNLGEDVPHAVIPLRLISFNIDSTR
jgi:hypothetical protein